MSAISGLEMALWDLAGQAAGVPIWQMFGGRLRERVPLYATGHNGVEETALAYASRAVELRELGLRGIKISVHPRASGVSPLELAHAVHASLGSDTWLAVDAHGAYSGPDAARLAASLADLELRWLEDPLPPENVDAMSAFTHHSPIPVCTGENLYGVFGFRQLLEGHATDIASPDVAKTGGLSQGRRIAQLADLHQVLFAPHDIGSPVQAVAVGHLACGVPNLLAMEQHWPDDSLWHGVVEATDLIIDGELVVPDAPGLGVRVKDREVKRRMRDETGFFR